ncbi:1,4-alpha-glucan branching protein GlgB [Providencia rettgeri]|nr:1,4-alpha-glucan branching protein GlgB [Providencia rettgeri]
MPKLPDITLIDRFKLGKHVDPFATLGMHKTASALEIRVLFPGATQIQLIDMHNNEKIVTLTQVDSGGFFVGIIPCRSEPFPYKLLVQWDDCDYLIDDPYQFPSLLSPFDHWLLKKGKHLRPYEILGAHPAHIGNIAGIRFCVWAPNAQCVSVIGDFNAWNEQRHPMRFHLESGIWELFIPEATQKQLYKYQLITKQGNTIQKADPYAFQSQLRPETASVICELPTKIVMTEIQSRANFPTEPMLIYEVHLGSWCRHTKNNTWLNYQELAEKLIYYVKDMGFTHIEILPIHEHPFDGSWGYQPIGLYAPTSRFGSPADFRQFVEIAHTEGVNVLLDWVPGHFPKDPHGLALFDGTPLYEYADPKEGVQQDWHTLIYNYARPEVCNFLSGNILYWQECFGVDGFRVDAVSSILYRDYSRLEGEWLPNKYGGNHNLEAIEFLRETNRILSVICPGVATFAEESTDFPQVTIAHDSSGLGFQYKWNLGWMNDTLFYMQQPPELRKHHHQKMSFGMLYAFSEYFILPISHDEVVHGKQALLNRMPGTLWQKFANLRAYFGFMWGYPGKKLIFMGCEFAQEKEWNHDCALDWDLLKKPHGLHSGIQNLIRDLNHCYLENPPFYACDYQIEGFEWLVVDDDKNSVFAFARYDDQHREIIVVSNFAEQTYHNYRIGVNDWGYYRERINTDSFFYGGNNRGNLGGVQSEAYDSHGKSYSLRLTLPPLTTIYLIQDVR